MRRKKTPVEPADNLVVELVEDMVIIGKGKRKLTLDRVIEDGSC